MSHSNQNQVIIAGASAAAANNADQREVPPPYLKLIADCWEHIFDYLSLEEIIVMGQTCKRMQQMAGYYVREYFPEHWFCLSEGVVYTNYSTSFPLRTDFYQYITSLCIKDELNDFLEADTFSSLKTIAFSGIVLSATEIQYTRNVLKNLENLHVWRCTNTDTESIKQLVAYCPKLKYLNIRPRDMSDLIIKSIFTQCLPTLDRLKLDTESDVKIDELKTFLEKHSKLKHFQCNNVFLWANRDLLIETNNVRFNILAIDLDLDTLDIPFERFVDFLKKLHARGFYKTLHLSFEDESLDIDENMANAIYTLPKLEKLDVMVNDMINLTRLNNLKELALNEIEGSVTDVEAIAKSMIELERLCIFNALDCGDFRPFIRYSKALKSIKIHLESNTDYFDDLIELNKERMKLDGGTASRVTMYMEEETYLLTKWKSQNVNLSHIEIRRLESYSH